MIIYRFKIFIILVFFIGCGIDESDVRDNENNDKKTYLKKKSYTGMFQVSDIKVFDKVKEKDKKYNLPFKSSKKFNEVNKQIKSLNHDFSGEVELLLQYKSEADINKFSPEGEGLEVLIELANFSPDSKIRIEALEQLEGAEGYAATEAAVIALEDSSAEVVLQALSTLEFIGDETVVRYIENLLDHPSIEVRNAAKEAIDFLN